MDLDVGVFGLVLVDERMEGNNPRFFGFEQGVGPLMYSLSSSALPGFTLNVLITMNGTAISQHLSKSCVERSYTTSQGQSLSLTRLYITTPMCGWWT